MARHVQQTELPLVRGRVPLLEDEEDLPIRLPKQVAAAVAADPAGAVRAMAKASEDKLAALTASGTAVDVIQVDGELRTPTPERALDQSRAGWPVNEDATLYTNWESTALPHWAGFYDVTDSKTGTLNARWWWAPQTDFWITDDPLAPPRKNGKIPSSMTGAQFRESYAWRGLKREPVDAYPVPPYQVEYLPAGVAISGKYLKRTRVKEA